MHVPDASEYREQSLAAWQAAAPAWERERPTIDAAAERVSTWLIDHVQPRPGATLLELAAGPGETGLRAAPLLLPGGRLITTDQAAAMVDVARRRAEELGLDNVEARVMDAERLELPAASVDGVLCRFGLMLLADPSASLREVHRVLRPQGAFAAAVWAGAPENPWAAIIGEPLLELGLLDRPDPGAPGMFALSDPARLRVAVTAAGLREPLIERIPVRFHYTDSDEYWRIQTSLSTATSRALRAADADLVDEVRARVHRGLEPFAAAGVIEIPGVALALSTGPAG
jgi:SAM-dependent methyltransferase